MGIFADITQIFAAGYGWLLVFLIMSWQLFAPKYLNQDTALAPIVRDVPEQVEDLAESQQDIRSDVDGVKDDVANVKENQKVSMQVQRAQARADPQMDEEKVDEYLMKNGVKPNSFLRGNEIEGYANWKKEDFEVNDE